MGVIVNGRYVDCGIFCYGMYFSWWWWWWWLVLWNWGGGRLVVRLYCRAWRSVGVNRVFVLWYRCVIVGIEGIVFSRSLHIEVRVGSTQWDGVTSWWGGSIRSRRGWVSRVIVVFWFFPPDIVIRSTCRRRCVVVACWGSRGSFRFFVGMRGVGDCDDLRLGLGPKSEMVKWVDGVVVLEADVDGEEELT